MEVLTRVFLLYSLLTIALIIELFIMALLHIQFCNKNIFLVFVNVSCLNKAIYSYEPCLNGLIFSSRQLLFRTERWPNPSGSVLKARILEDRRIAKVFLSCIRTFAGWFG